MAGGPSRPPVISSTIRLASALAWDADRRGPECESPLTEPAKRAFFLAGLILACSWGRLRRSLRVCRGTAARIGEAGSLAWKGFDGVEATPSPISQGVGNMASIRVSILETSSSLKCSALQCERLQDTPLGHSPVQRYLRQG